MATHSRSRATDTQPGPVPTLPHTGLDTKEEKLQIKSSINFLLMKSVGSFVRAYMLLDYKPPNSSIEVQPGERLILEGIYLTSSVSTCEFLLGMVEVIILSADEKRRFTAAVYLDQTIKLKMDNVAWLEFKDGANPENVANICREGLKKIPRVQLPKPVEVPPEPKERELVKFKVEPSTKLA